MADFADEVKTLSDLISDLKEKMRDPQATDAMKDNLSGMIQHLQKAKEGFLSGTGAVTAFSNVLQNLSIAKFRAAMDGIGDMLSDLREQFPITREQIEKFGLSVVSLYAVSSGRLKLSDELVKMGNQADESTAKMEKMTDRVADLLGIEMSGEKAKIVRNIMGQVDATQKLETSLLMTAAASGNLDAAMKSIGGEMSNLSDMTAEFAEITANAGTSNAITAGQAAEFAQQLMAIPGELTKVINATEDGSEKINMLDATIKVAKGTMQPFGNVMKDMTLLFENWNKTGRDSLDFVAKMASTAQSLKMPMDIMRQYVRGVGEQFKYLGDNTMGAIDIMNKMKPAFDNSRLGPQAIADLVGKMTKAVGQMDVAQRAFVSARTGGPGGLQGGYQLALQMQQGNTEAVFDKVTDALKGMFGGKIVTLEEAAQDARASAQFTKQVQMLTAGPLKMADTEAEAFNILEALSKGETPAGAKKKEDPLKAAMERGNEVQERYMNDLVRVNNEIAKWSQMTANHTASLIRATVGSESERAEALDEARQAARRRGTETDFQTGSAIGKAESVEYSAFDSARRFKDEAFGFVEDVIKPLRSKKEKEENIAPEDLDTYVDENTRRRPRFEPGVRGMTKEEFDRQQRLQGMGFAESETRKILEAGREPGRVRQDMDYTQRAMAERERSGRGEFKEPRTADGENVVRLQVVLDNEQLEKEIDLVVSRRGVNRPQGY